MCLLRGACGCRAPSHADGCGQGLGTRGFDDFDCADAATLCRVPMPDPSLAYPTTSIPIDRAVPATRLDRRRQRLGVQVGQLQLGDLLDLLHRDRADLVLVRLGRALGDVGGALEQHRRRRRLGDEGVRAVGVDRHHRRDDQPLVLRRAGVERLAEVHDVDAVRAERRAHRRGRRGLAGGNLELHHCLNFFCHCCRSPSR